MIALLANGWLPCYDLANIQLSGDRNKLHLSQAAQRETVGACAHAERPGRAGAGRQGCPLPGLECDGGGEGGTRGRSASGGVAGALCAGRRGVLGGSHAEQRGGKTKCFS